jgi:hypothetical protein
MVLVVSLGAMFSFLLLLSEVCCVVAAATVQVNLDCWCKLS